MSAPREGSEDVLSLEAFRRLPEEDGHRVELDRGRLVREPRPGAEHGWLTGRLVRLLGSHAESRELGIVVTETGFLLGEDPATVRGPDAAFISTRRLPAGGIPRGFWPMAPDLGVEVVSASNSASEIQEKVLDYLEAGTKLIWVVDPGSRTVTAWRPPREARVFREGETLEAGEALPGFRLDVHALFSR